MPPPPDGWNHEHDRDRPQPRGRLRLPRRPGTPRRVAGVDREREGRPRGTDEGRHACDPGSPHGQAGDDDDLRDHRARPAEGVRLPGPRRPGAAGRPWHGRAARRREAVAGHAGARLHGARDREALPANGEEPGEEATPEEPAAAQGAPRGSCSGFVSSISPLVTLGPVHLTVADLDRSLAYYSDAIGLETLERGPERASLGSGGRELLVLVEEPGARPAPHNTGLFHFALLVPERPALARWLAHAARERIGLTGLSNHEVSEAIYLRDPDGHGIEIYADRPRETWEGRVGQLMTTKPLDVDDLLREVDDPESEPFDRLADGTVMGHVHLQVAAIPDTVDFYRDLLGFDLMAQLGNQAAFLSAGGYHHHLGANTWQSEGAAPPPPGSAALRHATIVFPDSSERDRVAGAVSNARRPLEDGNGGPVVRDPSGNALLLTAAAV